MKKRRTDEVIIEVLKEGSKTNKELRKECLKRGAPPSSYNKKLRKLVERGEVKEAKFEYVDDREADTYLLLDCISIIKSDKPDEKRVGRAKHLERLCYWKRTAYAPKLLDFFKNSINDENEVVREYLVLALANLLWYEQKRTPRSHDIIKRIIDENLENMTNLASSENNFKVRVAVLRFLGYTGDIRALDPIFEIIKNCTENEYERLKEWIQWVLFTAEYLLAKKFKREVPKRLDQLLNDPIEQVRIRATELHKFMLSPNGMQ